MPKIYVENKTGRPSDIFISKIANGNGNDDWFNLSAGEGDSWNRSAGSWEVVVFSLGGNNSSVQSR